MCHHVPFFVTFSFCHVVFRSFSKKRFFYYSPEHRARDPYTARLSVTFLGVVDGLWPCISVVEVPYPDPPSYSLLSSSTC